MGLNLELKARLQSLERARSAAIDLGAHHSATLFQEDTYFVVPRGRLKLRTFGDGGAELVFYERSEDSLARWSNYSKTPVSDGKEVKSLLSKAFGVLAVVEKTREVFLFRNARIHIDTVRNLGEFLEFEIMEGGEAESTALMNELRRVFSIGDADVIRCSYSDMIVEKAE